MDFNRRAFLEYMQTLKFSGRLTYHRVACRRLMKMDGRRIVIYILYFM